MYRDEEAFDRRAHLSQQGVDLIGALRAPELSTVTTSKRAEAPNQNQNNQ
jgi:hypothetical protein